MIAAFRGPPRRLAQSSGPNPLLATEDPAIVAMGERIGPLLVAYRNVAEERLKARVAAEANCPAVPEELVCEGVHWAGCTESEGDVEGREIWPPSVVGENNYARRARRILHSESTKAAIALGNLYCDRRTKFGKEIARLIDTAEKYEAEREAAILFLPTTDPSLGPHLRRVFSNVPDRRLRGYR
jgi:hypothetical protein